jgi:hypothetical protein
VISSSQRPLHDNTQQTNIHAPDGIRTHDRSRRAAVELRLRTRGHLDRLFVLHMYQNITDIRHSCTNERSNICSEAKRERELITMVTANILRTEATCTRQVRWERLRKQGRHGVGARATAVHRHLHRAVNTKGLNRK